MKEFYENLVDITNGKAEVMVRGVKVYYFEGTINILSKLGLVKDRYRDLMVASDDVDYDVYMESLCNPSTKWVEFGGQKTLKIMDFRSESNVRYQSIKHFLRPITHNEIVNRKRSVLLHCITFGEGINMGKRHGVPQKAIDEICHPQVAFDKVIIQTLMKPKGRRRKPKVGQKLAVEASFKIDQILWKVLLQMQKDQRDFYKFSKEHFEWEKKLNEWNYNNEAMPVFPDHIIGELEEKNDQPLKEEEVKEKKKQKKAMFSGAHGSSSSGLPKEDTIERPRKKAINNMNLKQVKTIGVFEEDTERKKENKYENVVEESYDEDGRPLNELLMQVAKDKKEIMADAPERVQGKKIFEKEKVSDDEEGDQNDKEQEEDKEKEKLDGMAGSEKDDKEEAGNGLNGQQENETIS
ncbi:hypothetical protein KIW84_075326 [Lathyrus oleraceus]|uniref:Uncharacterized protein n=2 Tax=Pisum sativum TaxID=3888 RepID=A0A9D4ZZP9_PEA|nr:hypothetical protein KIW84_075326 [Pisum sativum]